MSNFSDVISKSHAEFEKWPEWKKKIGNEIIESLFPSTPQVSSELDTVGTREKHREKSLVYSEYISSGVIP